MYLTLTLNNSQHYWWYSVIPVATAVSLKVPAEGPQGMVSMSRNENENNSCQSSPSHQWEGWINQHTESNSPTAKDESSNSWSCWRCHPEPDPVLSWWLITLTSYIVTPSPISPSLSHPPTNIAITCTYYSTSSPTDDTLFDSLTCTPNYE